jgi:hypothetical protein
MLLAASLHSMRLVPLYPPPQQEEVLPHRHRGSYSGFHAIGKLPRDPFSTMDSAADPAVAGEKSMWHAQRSSSLLTADDVAESDAFAEAFEEVPTTPDTSCCFCLAKICWDATVALNEGDSLYQCVSSQSDQHMSNTASMHFDSRPHSPSTCCSSQPCRRLALHWQFMHKAMLQSPHSWNSITSALAGMQLGDVQLNTEQRRAVAAVVSLAPGRGPVTIFGPPGTGKTVTIVEAVLQVLRSSTCGTLLLCAPQNFSCDTLCTRLIDAKVDTRSMLRLMDPRLPVNRVVRLIHCHQPFGSCPRSCPRYVRTPLGST